MTYCFFSAQYPPTLGGVENHTRRLAEKIVEKGGRAIVVTSALPGLPRQETEETGVEVFRLPSLLPAGGRLPLLLPFGETRRVFRVLAGQKMDRVVVQTRLYLLSLSGVKFAQKWKIPAIVIEHGNVYTTTGNPLVDAGLRLYTSWLRRRVYRHCPHFYAVSQSAADWLGTQKISVDGLFYNAISAADVRRAAERPSRDFRAENAIPPGALAVAYAGRLIAQKGVLELVEAIKKYNQTAEEKMWLLLAGAGELAGVLGAETDPHVRLLGALPFGEVIALFTAADIVCLPTAMKEGLPSSVLEAGACGRFLLGTRMGGIEEIIPGPDYGLLLEDNRPETLCAALQTLAEDEPYRRRAAQNLQKRVMEKFTFDALYHTLETLPWR